MSHTRRVSTWIPTLTHIGRVSTWITWQCHTGRVSVLDNLFSSKGSRVSTLCVTRSHSWRVLTWIPTLIHTGQVSTSYKGSYRTSFDLYFITSQTSQFSTCYVLTKMFSISFEFKIEIYFPNLSKISKVNLEFMD